MIKASLDGGTDYAYGDATTADGTKTVTTTIGGLPVSVTINNMGQQVSDYLSTNPAPSTATLYVVWGGANDLYADSSTAAVTAAATREINLIQRLVTAGATDFLVPNLPPLGGVPDHASDPNAAALNAASASFRAQLATGLQALAISAAAAGKTLHLYQPDIFTQFATAASSPMSYALADVTHAAQGISGNPDTYLIWDGLHPTTTGHHFVAAVAENLLVPLTPSTTVLTVLPSATLAGQAVTLTAVVTGTGPSARPGGLVTFFSGTGANVTVVGSATLDSTGTATSTFSGSTAAGSPYTLTAVYAGDTAYTQSTSAAQTLTAVAAPIATATSLTSSNLNAGQGASVTFTATVSSAGGTPAGTVNFLEGTTTLGSGALNSSGVATFTTTTLPVGSHTITATYAANGIFAASASSQITETITVPAIEFSFSPASLTIPRGATGSTTITFTSIGGASGTLAPSCGALPAHLSCTFAPASVALSAGGTQTTTLTIATTTSSLLLFPTRPGSRTPPGSYLAVTLLPIWGLGLGARFSRSSRHRRSLTSLLALTVFAGVALGLTGCGSSENNTTAAGTYTVQVSYTNNGTANTVTHALQVIVQ